MRGMRLSLIAAALGSLPAPALANELVNVYHLAVDNDAQFAAAVHARDAALEARPQARAALLPAITGSYGYTRGRAKGDVSQISEFDTPVDTDGDGIPDSTQTQPLAFGQSINANTTEKNLNVSLKQPVFDWAAFMRYSRSADQLSAAEATYRQAEQNLLLRAAQAYFDYLAANDDLRFARAQNASLDRQLEQAKQRFEVGLSAVTDTQEAQASFDRVAADVIAAEQKLASAREALLEITGQRDAALVPLREEIPLPGPQPENVDEWLGVARDNNYDLALARVNARLAGLDVDIARAGHYPTLNLVGQYTDVEQTQDQRHNAVGDQSQELRGPAVGLQVNVPIFSGFLVQSQTRQAQSVEEQRKSELLGAERSVARKTRDAFLGVLTGSARVRALKQAVSSNQTALEASETGLEVGTRTTVDVLNAQSLLYSAQRDYARARYDYLIAILNLKAASGRLNESDLGQIDGLLTPG